MCRLILTLICCTNIYILDAQPKEAAQNMIAQVTKMEQQIKKHSTPVTKSRNHNLYISQGWQNSAVVTKTGETIYFNGRFNVLDNSIELKNKSGIRSIRANRVSAGMVGGKYFIAVAKDQIKEQANTSFYEVLSLGDINLYNKHYLKSRMTGSNSLTSAYNGEKEYFIDEELYFHSDEHLCQKMRSKKKTLALFGDHKLAIETFAKENNLKFKSKGDLTRIFDYYNSLIAD